MSLQSGFQRQNTYFKPKSNFYSLYFSFLIRNLRLSMQNVAKRMAKSFIFASDQLPPL